MGMTSTTLNWHGFVYGVSFLPSVLPMRATGNSHSSREMNGIDLVNLALFRLVRPKSYINEVRAYVQN